MAHHDQKVKNCWMFLRIFTPETAAPCLIMLDLQTSNRMQLVTTRNSNSSLQLKTCIQLTLLLAREEVRRTEHLNKELS